MPTFSSSAATHASRRIRRRGTADVQTTCRRCRHRLRMWRGRLRPDREGDGRHLLRQGRDRSLQAGVREGLSRRQPRRAEPQHECGRALHRRDQEQQPDRPHVGVRARRVRGAQEQEAAPGLQAQGDRHSREGRLLSGERSGGLLFRFRGLRLRHHVERALRQGEPSSRAEGMAGPRQARISSTTCRSPRPRARAPRT